MEGAGRHGRVVQIVGDGVDGDWLTWRWNDLDWPVGVHCAEEFRGSVAAFRSVLSREPDSDKGESPCDLEWLVTFKTVNWQDGLKRLGLYGPLARRNNEPGLMRVLSRALLPGDSRRQLIEAVAGGERVEMRVTPNPPVAIVPWGLLVLDDDDMWLLDVADVSQIALTLSRDINPNVPYATPATGGWALHAIDPKTSKERVLSGTFEPYGCHGHDVEQFSTGYNGLEKLRVCLETGAGKTAQLLMIGHCITGTRDAADTVFPMGDGETNKLRASRLMREAGRWRIPLRIGIVACVSGTDLAQHEPLRLGIALLINGAGVLQVTLWTLPADYATGLMDTGAVGAFEWLAQAVDHAQSDAGPVASLCDLQRKKLAVW